jgi:3-deoxy-D-manno-octulosonate 8-phosphate phosphatase (KDO 8-P phosphatase)
LVFPDKGIKMKYKLMIFDNDGVFTDGGLYYMDGIEKFRKFNAKDGLGIRILQQTSLKPAIITGKRSTELEKRAEILGIDLLFQGIRNKLVVVKKLCEKFDATLSEVVYVGDDLNDLPVLKKVGLPICVHSACDELQEVCLYCTKKDGGAGAVREAIEFVLKKENEYKQAVNKFIKSLQ